MITVHLTLGEMDILLEYVDGLLVIAPDDEPVADLSDKLHKAQNEYEESICAG